MRTAILLNRSRSGLRSAGKKALTAAYQAVTAGELADVVLPEYDSFASLVDEDPLILGTGDPIDWDALRDRELLIWEWGWTATPARTLLEIKSRCDVPVLMFPGPLDRFWRELSLDDLELQMSALQASDAIGVMLEDTAPFYRALAPHASVVHLPVPVDVERFRAHSAPPSGRDRDKILLTAPTRFTGPASQLPVATFVAFKIMLRSKPSLRGLCFVYDSEERAGAERGLKALGLEGKVDVVSYLRPIQRYLGVVAPCWAGLSLPHGLLQGRSAMTAACLGLPMVLSEEIETHRRLFPDTSVRWHDAESAAELCLRLIGDQGFRDRVVAKAAKGIEAYSVENCRRRLLDAARAAAERRAKRGRS